MNKIDQQDLDAFFDFYEQTHICPYYFCKKAKIQEIIANYASRTPIENDLGFVYFFRYMLKRLVGELDSHSMIRTRDEYEKLPLQITSKNSRFVVGATSPQYTNYLHKTITEINGVALEQLAKESENAISYSTNGYLQLETDRFLSHYDPLRTLPSISSKTTEIIYTFADGDELKVRVGDSGFIEMVGPDNYQIDFSNGELSLHYNACREEFPGQMREALGKIKNYDTKCFVLDLRGNTGGDDRVIRPLIEYLETRPDLEKWVLVDRAVQSAALFALNDIIKLGAKICGTEIGSSLNHIGNNCRIELPSGRFLTIVATRYFYIDEQDNFVTIRTPGEFKKLDKKYVTPKYPKFNKTML